MLCNNCGKPVEDGQELCPECLAAQQAAAPQEEAPAEQSVPMEETTPAAESAPIAESAPVKKGKGGLIAILAAAAVVVIAAIVLALNWSNWFPTPQQYLIKVESAALSEGFQAVHAASSTQQAAPIDKNHASTTMRVELGENIMAVLSLALSQDGTPVDMSWMENILLQVDTNNNKDRSQVDVGIGLNATKILTLRMIVDMQTNMLYAGIPEATDSYLYGYTEADLTSIMSNSVRAPILDEETQNQIMAKLPDAETSTQLVNKYLTVAFADLQTVERSAETVTVNEISQEMTVLTVTLNESQCRDISVAILQTLQNDDRMKQMAEAYLLVAQEVCKQNPAYADMLDEIPTADELWAQIPEEIAKLQAEEVTTDKNLTYRVYVDENDKICGRLLQLPTEETVLLSYMTAKDGENFSMEAVLKTDSEIRIIGNGTAQNSVFTLTADEREVMVLEVSELDMQAFAKGELYGSFKLKLGKDLWNDLKDAMDQQALAVLAVPSLQTTITREQQEYSLYVGGMMLFKVTAEIQPLEATDIKIPLSPNVQYFAHLWLEGMEFDTILENLEKAGVPQEYVDALLYMLEAAKAENEAA